MDEMMGSKHSSHLLRPSDSVYVIFIYKPYHVLLSVSVHEIFIYRPDHVLLSVSHKWNII